ncbi:MAG: hypothetical protein BGO31_10190 [Bacteroidetes bacterium 43-16]|nr:MAG: hypothetical protein BGO31_10190 [Bacteroidetes bacterium 43-16]
MSGNKEFHKKQRSAQDEALWDYISGQLPVDKAHDYELEHIDDPFWNDAAEGLGSLKDPALAKKMQLQLQQQIVRQTQSRKEKRRKSFQQSSLIAVFVLLILVILLSLLLVYMK